jgi:hypothetical protein
MARVHFYLEGSCCVYSPTIQVLESNQNVERVFRCQSGVLVSIEKDIRVLRVMDGGWAFVMTPTEPNRDSSDEVFTMSRDRWDCHIRFGIFRIRVTRR